MSEHTLEWLYFGPVLLKSNITDEFRLGLLERAKKLDRKYNHRLAGHIEGEYEFAIDDREYFMHNFMPYVEKYIEKLNHHMNHGQYNDHSFAELKGLWVNFMEKGEYNPPHIHGDDLSFVLYLDVPQEIHNETDNWVGTHRGPGSIDFMYGESMKDMRCHYNIVPKTGDIFIFNALLRHWVSPFRSDVTRTSMSGNLLLK